MPFTLPLAPERSSADGAAAYEAERQRVLDSYRILDTDPEFAFDDLVKLASLVCQTPISLISLVDRDRQWFKARVGLDTSETPRNVAFCDYVVAQKAPMEIRDAHNDPRFADNPLVLQDPNIRFYAGVPLRTPDDYCLGSICVIDKVPRELTDTQRQALATIAEQVMAQLELKLRNRQLETGYNQLTRANRRLDQFTSMVSQDLKAPLSGLLNLTDLLVGDARAGHVDAVCEALTVMSAEVGRMQKRVGGLLQFARATRPAEQVEDVDLTALLREVIAGLPGAGAFHFSLPPHLPVLRTAREPLRLVFVNLFQNAIEHHPPGGGHIAVTAEQGPGVYHYTFHVSDDGAGIAPQLQDTLFQLLPPASAGTGVGLATVKHLVEDYGGHVRVDSQPGQGATFTFTWAATPESAPVRNG